MDQTKHKKLEEMGRRITSSTEFLELTPEEELLVKTGLAASNLVRATRSARGFSQAQLAVLLGTKQPNIARLEQAAGTSFDALFQALYAMGVSPSEIGAALEGVGKELVIPQAHYE